MAYEKIGIVYYYCECGMPHYMGKIKYAIDYRNCEKCGRRLQSKTARHLIEPMPAGHADRLIEFCGLEYCCNALGWQGGTRQQVISSFCDMSIKTVLKLLKRK